ncbi:hypothetical protein DSL64_25235 [Dyadobacter luteus]|jgi:hypothetical protein|uniref:Lipopolysaccharide biosynthesis protein n=1 Tax=Dyadobacter luteus TaxID=2259619 RepID=A0A3D8Y4E6_9BACT|nr:hypothetical protein [Dyadobacter luteus]REA56959.1 hypothetical protein DSL64_25235 [Dyadobacter luteus]
MSTTARQVPEDELTPQDVIEKIQVIKRALIKNWIVLVLLPGLGFGIGYVLDLVLKTPNEYEADVVFNLGGSQSSGGLGDMAGLLGLGNAPDANIFTGENFFYFVKSRPVIERNLLKEVDIHGKKMILANFFIDSSGIKQKEWEETPDLHNFRFTSSDVKKLDMPSRVVLNQLVRKATDLTDIGPLERKSSFSKLSAKAENETLAGLWVTSLLTTVEEMYTENQTQKSRKQLRLLESRRDSLGRVLGVAESRLAREVDLSTQVFDPMVKVSASRSEKKSAFLQSMYYEAMASAEKMRVSLVREAPLFTEIEGIKVPLDMKATDKTRAKIGLLIGLFLALIFTYLRTALAPAPKPVQA